jgi:predicted transcriptional regulator
MRLQTNGVLHNMKSINIDDGLHRRVKTIAVLNEVSMRAFIEAAIKSYVEAYEAKNSNN